MTCQYKFENGETIQIAVTDSGALEADAALVVARIKRLPPGKFVLPADSVIAATFSTSYRAADETFARGWTFTLHPTDAEPAPAGSYRPADLAPGLYHFDFTVSEAGGTWKSLPAILDIREAAS